MALLFIDSYDHYATSDAVKKGYSSSYFAGTPGDIGASIGAYGRNSTNGLRCRSSASAGQRSTATLTISNASGTTCIIGVAFKMNVLPSSEALVCQIWNDSAVQISLTVSSGGSLSVRRGGLSGTVLVTTATTLSAATFYFLELKILFDNTAGTYEVRIDGVSAGSGTGADTINSGTAGFDSIVFGNTETAAPLTLDFDDLYVCDGTGGANNDFLGDHRIVCKVASSGNGSNTDWSPSTGSDHGALVDEATPNTSDYVSSDTSGEIDTYNFAALGVTGTVKALQTCLYVSAQVGGVRELASVSRIGGVNYADANEVTLGADWTYLRTIKTVSPATSSAWTVAEIDGAEFGVKVTA